MTEKKREIINNEREASQYIYLNEIEEGINDPAKKVIMIPLPTASGKTYMVSRRVVPLFLSHIRNPGTDGCGREFKGDEESEANAFDSVIIAMPQRQQVASYREELIEYVQEKGEMSEFTEDEILTVPTLRDTARTINERLHNPDLHFWKEIFRKSTDERAVSDYQSGRKTSSIKTIEEGLKTIAEYCETLDREDAEDEKSRDAGSFISSIWKTVREHGNYSDEERRFVKRIEGENSKDGGVPYSEETLEILKDLFPRELSNQITLKHKKPYRIFLCTFSKLALGLSKNKHDAVFMPKSDKNPSREALILDEVDRFYNVLLERQIEATAKGLPLIEFLRHVHQRLRGYIAAEEMGSEKFALSVRNEIHSIVDEIEGLARLNGMYREDEKVNPLDVGSFLPDFILSDEVINDGSIKFNSRKEKYLTKSELGKYGYEPPYTGPSYQARICFKNSHKNKKVYDLRRYLEAAERIFRHCIQLARMFRYHPEYIGGTAIEKTDDEIRATAADMIGATDERSKKIVAASIFNPLGWKQYSRYMKDADEDMQKEIRRHAYNDRYALGFGFTSMDNDQNHGQRIDFNYYNCPLLPSYLLRCIIGHFDFTCGFSATALLQGVSSFDLDYISRDFWGNSIAVQVPKEKSRAAEEHFDHAKSILYKYSPFHVFFANGMHEMKKDGCTDIMNPENDEVICKDFNNNRLLNNERQPGTGNLSYDAVSVIQAASIWKDHGHENRCMLFMVIQHSGPKTDGTDVNDISRIRNMVESLSRVSTNNLLNQIDDFYYGTVRSGKVTIYDSYVQEIYSDDEKGMDTEDLTVYRDPKSLNTDKIRICIRESSAAKVFLFVPEEDARGYNYELSVNGNLYNISGLAIS